MWRMNSAAKLSRYEKMCLVQSYFFLLSVHQKLTQQVNTFLHVMSETDVKYLNISFPNLST